MRTYVYIDGFNLYYGAVKNTSYKWLDLSKLCHSLLPKNDVRKIHYFTALVTARSKDPQQSQRQLIYLRALKTIPNLEITYGHFLSQKVTMPLANPIPGQPHYVQVIKTEEKGSDVNLATQLLHDGYQDLFDIAVLISNDSDLLSPVKILREHLGKKVGILNPHRKPSNVLLKNSDFYKPVREGVLRISQFPRTLSDKHGDFEKPSSW